MDPLAGLDLLLTPVVFASLLGGVVLGLAVGLIPGIGGGVAMALLLPFTIAMDPAVAFAAIVGLMAVNTTSDTIPAVMFGVPGTSGSAATILDGHPMSRQGRTKEALGAAYASSMAGGIFGALLLAVSVPVMAVIIPYIGTPELLAMCILGLCFASAVSGRSVLKGLASACLGLLASFIGLSSQTGEARWTFGSLYFWDGLPFIPIALALFAVPALLDMVRLPTAMTGQGVDRSDDSILRGVAAAGRHWFLVLRSSWIGAGLGAVPGIGSSVIDWIAYGTAVRTARDPERFGKGDIRGVIAPESSNNAKDGGALIPTLALGVPGSVGMALVLGAFLIHGITPGPDMLGQHISLTYMFIWGLVIANLIGGGICLLCTGHLARLLQIPTYFLVPAILAVVFLGAFQGSQSIGDLWLMLGVGAAAYFLKTIDWPRPPLILGLILGEVIERYLFISGNLYGWAWMLRPATLVILLIAAYALLRPLVGRRRASTFSTEGTVAGPGRATALASAAFAACAIAVIATGLVVSTQWGIGARTGPQIVGTVALALFCAILALSLRDSFRLPPSAAGPRFLHGIAVLAAMAGYILLVGAIGMLPALLVFVPGVYFILGGRPGRGVVLLALGLFLAAAVLFDRLLAVPWPHPIFPQLQNVIFHALR